MKKKFILQKYNKYGGFTSNEILENIKNECIDKIEYIKNVLFDHQPIKNDIYNIKLLQLNILHYKTLIYDTYKYSTLVDVKLYEFLYLLLIYILFKIIRKSKCIIFNLDNEINNFIDIINQLYKDIGYETLSVINNRIKLETDTEFNNRMNKIIVDFSEDILFLQEVNYITSKEYINKIEEKYTIYKKEGKNTFSHSIICISKSKKYEIILEQNKYNNSFRDIRNILLLFTTSNKTFTFDINYHSNKYTIKHKYTINGNKNTNKYVINNHINIIKNNQLDNIYEFSSIIYLIYDNKYIIFISLHAKHIFSDKDKLLYIFEKFIIYFIEIKKIYGCEYIIIGGDFNIYSKYIEDINSILNRYSIKYDFASSNNIVNSNFIEEKYNKYNVKFDNLSNDKIYEKNNEQYTFNLNNKKIKNIYNLFYDDSNKKTFTISESTLDMILYI